jgi:hypothetical protein
VLLSSASCGHGLGRQRIGRGRIAATSWRVPQRIRQPTRPRRPTTTGSTLGRFIFLSFGFLFNVLGPMARATGKNQRFSYLFTIINFASAGRNQCVAAFGHADFAGSEAQTRSRLPQVTNEKQGPE